MSTKVSELTIALGEKQRCVHMLSPGCCMFAFPCYAEQRCVCMCVSSGVSQLCKDICVSSSMILL